MRIAILGATSMLAADFVASGLAGRPTYDVTLFSRDSARATAMLALRGVPVMPASRSLDGFADGQWDAIINFVGVGDPARAVVMGADILRITREWDDRVLDYLGAHPRCRYIFLSSGAAFGLAVADPADRETRASFDINRLKPSAYYGISKFYAEALHRSHADRSIIDVRIFNYISEFADLDHRFLVNEALAAIRDGRTLKVDPVNIWRDYLGRADFAHLMTACLEAPSGYNGAVDAYSLSPISKMAMLDFLKLRFGLEVEVSGGGIDATGIKSRYFSCNRAAEALGYRPGSSSIDTLERVASYILGRSRE